MPEPTPESIGLPIRPFLYTLDQIAVVLDIKERTLQTTYVYYENRSIGVANRHLLLARNVAPPDKKAEWRVAEKELLRWLKVKGFKYYDASVVLK